MSKRIQQIETSAKKSERGSEFEPKKHGGYRKHPRCNNPGSHALYCEFRIPVVVWIVFPRARLDFYGRWRASLGVYIDLSEIPGPVWRLYEAYVLLARQRYEAFSVLFFFCAFRYYIHIYNAVYPSSSSSLPPCVEFYDKHNISETDFVKRCRAVDFS